METRQHWGTKLGFLLAAVGSAVGLGNIWKFPYVMGENGGALFLIIYLVCILLVGIPVLVSELLLGRRNQLNTVDSFKNEFPKKPYVISGWFGLFTSVFILGYYIVVAGWCMYYIYSAFGGNLNFSTSDQATNYFTSFITNRYSPLLWLVLFMVINCGILLAGIKKGIERASKLLMPLLFIILLVLVVRALTLGNGVEKGLAFMFEPDFSKITGTLLLSALGLAFFKLSLGMGIMITYGSYLKKDSNLVSTSVKIAGLDTLVSLLAGLAIFPTIFALGFEPNGGTGLTFTTIPALLGQLPFGQVFGVLFFIALFVAALTSSISIYEVSITFFTERYQLSRKLVIIVSATVITIIGVLVSVYLGQQLPFFKRDLFDTLDMLTSIFLMPLGGLLLTIGMGWSLKKQLFFDELGTNSINKILYFLIKWIAPISILIIFIYGISEL